VGRFITRALPMARSAVGKADGAQGLGIWIMVLLLFLHLVASVATNVGLSDVKDGLNSIRWIRPGREGLQPPSSPIRAR
jgi:hypothetical protein